MKIRNVVFDALRDDVTLRALGIDDSTIFPLGGSLDSPQMNRWVTLRWGQLFPGMGEVKRIDLQLWAYDREPDFGGIDDILKRCRDILLNLGQVPMAPGWTVAVEWLGSSDDFSDDVYKAVTRNESYTIIASGM